MCIQIETVIQLNMSVDTQWLLHSGIIVLFSYLERHLAAYFFHSSYYSAGQ